MTDPSDTPSADGERPRRAGGSSGRAGSGSNSDSGAGSGGRGNAPRRDSGAGRADRGAATPRRDGAPKRDGPALVVTVARSVTGGDLVTTLLAVMARRGETVLLLLGVTHRSVRDGLRAREPLDATAQLPEGMADRLAMAHLDAILRHTEAGRPHGAEPRHAVERLLGLAAPPALVDLPGAVDRFDLGALRLAMTDVRRARMTRGRGTTTRRSPTRSRRSSSTRSPAVSSAP